MSKAKKEDINSSLPVPYEDDGTDYWQDHLDSWVQSGLSQAAYCRRHDLDYGRFRKWKERLSTYPKHSSIKLVEVKRDFAFNASPQFHSPFFVPGDKNHSYGTNIPPEINRFVNRQPSNNSSGIRFWCGPFCIEIDVGFSTESLSQLIGTLQDIRLQDLQGSPITNSNGNNDNQLQDENGFSAVNVEYGQTLSIADPELLDFDLRVNGIAVDLLDVLRQEYVLVRRLCIKNEDWARIVKQQVIWD